MSEKPLTEAQERFIDAIVEQRGNVAQACAQLDISETWGYKLVRQLREHIIARAESILALHAPRAAFEYADALDGTTIPANQTQRMEAAKQILDRVGIIKKEKVEIDANVNGGILILPPRKPVED